MRYKDFDIEVFEDEAGKFKAAIRRPDGRPLGPAVPPDDPRVPVMVTHAYPSAETVIAQAKRSIDAGGIV